MTSPDDAVKYQAGEPRLPERLPADVVISPDTRRANRIPPGQSRTRKWPVLHYGHVPEIPLDKWRLEIVGLVRRPRVYSWDEFQQLPRMKVFADFHCVTRWSRLDNIWEGVAVAELRDRADVLPEARFVILHGYDSGWTTNLPLADFQQADCLLADRHDGALLTAEHGGPLRAIVPQLYAWKSAKWLRRIELSAEDRPGYWEQSGYHNHGDPWVTDSRHPDGERFQ
jgi:DMSO/TMAO reductase YedYZ molybdopterin-dependent catalytic subunit